jgi:hypothetical protein
MNRMLAFALWLGMFQAVLGQTESLVDELILDSLRVVEDSDGQTNVRSGPSIEAKVVGHVASGSVVAVDAAAKGAWRKLSYDDWAHAPHYIHSSRLKKMDAWKQFEVGDVSDKDLGSLKLAGLEVSVRSAPFVAADHQITRDSQGIHLVDGKSPWGQDGGLPKQSLSLAVTQNGKPVVIPKEAVQNLFEPNMDSLTLLTPSNPSDHAVVLMINSDGAGGYCVAWSFQNGRYLGRVVFCPF